MSSSQPTLYRSGRNGSIVCDKKDSASCTLVKNGSSKTSILSSLLIAMIGLNTVLANDVSTDTVALNNVTVNSIDEALQHNYDNYGGSNDTDIVYYITETDTYITNITYPTNVTQSNLAKRWNAHDAPLGTWFTQHQIAQQGFWDQRWYPASGCNEQALGGGGTFGINWSQTTTWSVDAGFDFDIGHLAALSSGVSIEKSYSSGGTVDCNIQQWQGVGQVWTQKRMVWQDQQKQRCVRRDYGRNGLHCDAWSAYIHGDIPSDIPYNTGCSSGWQNVQC